MVHLPKDIVRLGRKGSPLYVTYIHMLNITVEHNLKKHQKYTHLGQRELPVLLEER